MNRKIKKLINKHTYHRGIEIGKELRAELIRKATTMEKEGKTEAFIIQALGIPLSEHDLIAQKAAK